MAISGNDFRRGAPAPASYGFSRYPLIWGWATWRRAWAHYDPELRAWPELREAGWLADLLGDRHAAAYWAHLFERAHDGIDTWDYGWMFSCWRGGPGRAPRDQPRLEPRLSRGRDPHPGGRRHPARSPRCPRRRWSSRSRIPPAVARDPELDAFLEDVAFSGNLRRIFDAIRAAQRVREAAPREVLHVIPTLGPGGAAWRAGARAAGVRAPVVPCGWRRRRFEHARAAEVTVIEVPRRRFWRRDRGRRPRARPLLELARAFELLRGPLPRCGPAVVLWVEARRRRCSPASSVARADRTVALTPLTTGLEHLGSRRRGR